MVNFFVVSEYSQDPPTEAGQRLKIASNGPLYELARVQALAANGSQIRALTKKCLQDVEKLFAGEYGDVARLVQCIRSSDYQNSEWCESGAGAVAACDAYVVRRVEDVSGTNQAQAVDYFLKFAIGKAGQLVLMVSCHLS